MRRRDFIAFSVGVAVGLDCARVRSAARRPVIGVLALSAAADDARLVDDFVAELARLGYVDGKSVTIVRRYAAFEAEKLAPLAAELAAMRPDVILADSASPIKAARAAAPSVPIVGTRMAYPVDQGLVSSFAHPGGTVTGLATEVDDMDAKVVELLVEAIPNVKSIGLLLNPGSALAVLQRRADEGAAAKLGVPLHTAEARTPDEIEGAIHALAAAGVSVLALQSNAVFIGARRRLAELALAARLPTVTSGQVRDMVQAGIMLNYAVDIPALYRRAAVFVDKILKGALPGDLPIEFPTELHLEVNLKTARALGVTIPPSVLLRADQVIE